ncbi:hypothetical protein [Pontibacter fetidus]|uniref:Uncharacterized protein n=1 Tax=Pontibacter fetidus TaxID=2700082 RepID=A0A6B2HA80_9BACT|nr:hypothetical protein [Pontibacter fetidus]NDK56314.1 hypothetical protein [Pontibacter fetidus]
MKVAIVTRNGNNSPKVLALSLQFMFSKLNVTADILEIFDTFARAFPLLSETRNKAKLHFKLYEKVSNLLRDYRNFSKLGEYNLIVFCECTPNGFWRNYYNIEHLKKLYPEMPLAFYEVYYLGNAPTQIVKLTQNNDHSIERYDWHFAVSDVTEIKSNPDNSWSKIGLDITYTGLSPVIKNEFIVIVDFEQSGYKKLRQAQLDLLHKLNIKYISLESRYEIQEIREIYKQGVILLLQSPEAFGLPIAECLATGCMVATPTSAWPMAWRKGENLQPGGEGELPDCFIVYKDIHGLENQLFRLKNNYDPVETPKNVFNTFYNHYPYFYEGDLDALSKSLKAILNN